MKFAQNIPDAPIGFSNKDISVTLGTYTALDQKFKKKKSTASMPISGRKPADLYFLTPRFAPPFLSILPYPAGQKYSGLLGAQKRGTPKPFGQSVPLLIWSELIQNVVMLMVPVTRSMAHSRFSASLLAVGLMPYAVYSWFSMRFAAAIRVLSSPSFRATAAVRMSSP